MSAVQVCACLTLVLSSSLSLAQQVVPLWADEAPPYSKPHTVEEYEADCWGVICAYQVVNPTLTIYTPKGEGNGTLVLVLPGGGYDTVAIYHEGHEIAEFLAEHGTTAAVLKYRLPSPETSTQPELVPLSDVRQALHLLRSNQTQFGFSAVRFGVMGFSAGSHLATFAGISRADAPDQNPDFSMLIYGVTRLTPENLEWLEGSLYHRKLTEAEIAEQTLLERVDKNTPPAFLVHAFDDDTCHYTESTLYAEALTRHGVPAELHLFADGGHGFGRGREGGSTSQWLELAASWLDRLGALQHD